MCVNTKVKNVNIIKFKVLKFFPNNVKTFISEK